MTHYTDIHAIKERLEKVKIVATPARADIYEAQRDDIRTLLKVIDEQEQVIASLSVPQGVA